MFAAQSADIDAPIAPTKDPDEAWLQVVAPKFPEKAPEGQSVYPVAPLDPPEDEKEPMGTTKHKLAPKADEYAPTMHAVTTDDPAC